VHDELGTACGHYAETMCSDCGTSLCSAHTERCGLYSETFCASCLTFHLAHLNDHPKVAQRDQATEHPTKKTA